MVFVASEEAKKCYRNAVAEAFHARRLDCPHSTGGYHQKLICAVHLRACYHFFKLATRWKSLTRARSDTCKQFIFLDNRALELSKLHQSD